MIAIGFDIGGTAIKAGCLRNGRDLGPQRQVRTPAEEDPRATVEVLAVLAGELEEEAGERARALGIGCAGLVEPSGGIVRTSPNLPRWSDVPLAAMVEARTGRRPLVLNDANAFTLAEARLGAARGAGAVVGLTLGTGVGGGILLDGRLWTGRHGYAGELGHTPVSEGGPLCSCGASGCLESVAGAAALLRSYRARTGGGAAHEAALDPRLLAERARAGETAAAEVLREAGRLLGVALGGFVHALDPDVIVIGGGLSGAADLLLPPARAAMAERLLLPRELIPPVVPAELGNAAGWIGSALAAGESAGSGG